MFLFFIFFSKNRNKTVRLDYSWTRHKISPYRIARYVTLFKDCILGKRTYYATMQDDNRTHTVERHCRRSRRRVHAQRDARGGYKGRTGHLRDSRGINVVTAPSGGRVLYTILHRVYYILYMLQYCTVYEYVRHRQRRARNDGTTAEHTHDCARNIAMSTKPPNSGGLSNNSIVRRKSFVSIVRELSKKQ